MARTSSYVISAGHRTMMGGFSWEKTDLAKR